MNTIIFPLSVRMSGVAVADLQTALQTLLDKNMLRGDDPVSRLQIPNGLRQESAGQRFGKETKKTVQAFQRQYNLPVTGTVDEATANALNQVILRLDGEQTFVVQGHVLETDGTPFMDGLVQAYDQGIRANRVLIGQAWTDRKGFYEIHYHPGDLNKEWVNLTVEVPGGGNTVISAPVAVRYRAGKEETVDLEIDPAKYILGPEHTRVHEAVQREIGAMQLHELDSAEDIRVVAANTGLDEQKIEHAVAAARFQEATGLPAELGFVLTQQNLPLSPRHLFRQNRSRVQEALEKAVAGNLIPETPVAPLMAQLQARAIEEELQIDPVAEGDVTLGSLFDLSPILAGSNEVHAARRYAFVEAYFNSEQVNDEFWSALKKEPEFADPAIREEFRFALELGNLTYSVPVARAIQTELRQYRAALNHYDLARLDLPTVRRLVESVGVPAEQVNDRADQIYRPLEVTFGTRVVFHQLDREDTQLPGWADLRNFLQERFNVEPDFDLGRRHARSYLGAAADTVERDKMYSVGSAFTVWRRYTTAPKPCAR